MRGRGTSRLGSSSRHRFTTDDGHLPAGGVPSIAYSAQKTQSRSALKMLSTRNISVDVDNISSSSYITRENLPMVRRKEKYATKEAEKRLLHCPPPHNTATKRGNRQAVLQGEHKGSPEHCSGLPAFWLGDARSDGCWDRPTDCSPIGGLRDTRRV